MKKFAFRAALSSVVLAIFAMFSVVPAMAVVAASASFSVSAPTFYAGANTPPMSFTLNPSGQSFNRVHVAVYDAAGTNLVTTGQINMGYGVSQSACKTVLSNPLVGCTKDGDDAGFYEYQATSTTQTLSLDGGLFTLPTTPGNYTFKFGFYNNGSEFTTATVAFTTTTPQFNITFDASGGSGTQQAIVTNGTSFTLPANTFTPPSGKVFAGWVDIPVSSTILLPGNSYTVSADTVLTAAWTNSNQQQQNQSVPFTISHVGFSRGNAPSFSTLAVGANVPAFTMTFSGFSGGAAVDQVNYLLGDPYSNVFYTVPGATTNNGNNLVSWNPASSTCGITAIRIGGVAQTANSGVTCLKSTYTNNGVTQYWNSIKFSSPTSAEISIDTAAGVFVVSQAGNLNYFATLFNNSVNPRWMSNNIQPFDGSNASSPAQAVSPVSFTIPVAPGQRIVGEDIAITATDLALSTDYSVVLRSTPQVLAQGRTVSSSFNTSVTIPNNLEAGWHSITFSATRSDGTALEEKVYFKINADGTLLASSTDVPAELAFTGMITAGAIPLSIIVLLMGFAAFFIAREINPDFMRVMTLTRNSQGELDFVKRRIRSEDF